MQTINQFYEINKDMSLHICLLGASKYAYDIIKLKPIRFGRHGYKRLERYGYLPSNYHFYVGKIIDSYDVDMSENNIGRGCYEGVKAIAEKISSDQANN